MRATQIEKHKYTNANTKFVLSFCLLPDIPVAGRRCSEPMLKCEGHSVATSSGLGQDKTAPHTNTKTNTQICKTNTQSLNVKVTLSLLLLTIIRVEAGHEPMGPTHIIQKTQLQKTNTQIHKCKYAILKCDGHFFAAAAHHNQGWNRTGFRRIGSKIPSQQFILPLSKIYFNFKPIF